MKKLAAPPGRLRRAALALLLALLLLMPLAGSLRAEDGIAKGSRQAPPDRPDLPAGSHKVVAPAGVLDESQAGLELLSDYGSYALYRVSDAVLDGLASAPGVQVRIADDMDRILIDAYPFNSQTDTLDLPAVLRVDKPQGATLQLIQFVGPIKAAWLEAVRAAGATPIHYIANNGYLVWADDDGRLGLDRLLKTGGYLQYNGVYQPYFKLGASVRARILEPGTPDEIVEVTVQVYDHGGKGATRDLVEALAVEQIAPWTPILAYQNTIVRLRAADLKTIARQPDVVWVGEYLPRERLDEVQDQILAGNTPPSGPGYLAWLDGHGLSTNPNDYPIVDVVDDGIGNGTVNSGDYTLYQFGNLGNPTRLAYVANCTLSADGGGLDGHGHINASIVGGYDANIGFPYQDPGGYRRGLGVSPYGRLAGTRIFNDLGWYDTSNCGYTDTNLIKKIQDNGAQIASNSWGCGACAPTYDDSSQAFDVGVRDADQGQPGNQELIFVFAAGNDGPQSGTVGSPGNGKNMITVGASENVRPSDEDGPWTDGCQVGPTGADNAMDVIDFSSRGPVPGGRVKPEVIAPGTHIQGTASTDPGYTGYGVCDKYRPSGQTVFAASSGTSHSTPAVAGVASLYYHWLETTYGLTPSPALMKAYLIAHPTYLTGVDANDTLPSNDQGYGMPDLSLGLDGTPRHLVNQSHVFDNSGETWTWAGSVADPARPVRIVLAYTDKAGAIGTSPQVNDLNLAATVGGTAYLGNVFSGQWSLPGGAPDPANNYEAIFLPAGTTGSIAITVTGFNIADDGVPNSGDGTDQDFALVCYNCTTFPDFGLLATPGSQAICTPDAAVYDLTVSRIEGFGQPVTLSASGQPAGTTATFVPNPVTPPGISVLTIGNTAAAPEGSYAIDITGTAAGALEHTTTVALDLYTTTPSVPVLSTPAEGAVDVPLTPTFTWSAAAQAASYNVEIATDAAFSNIVDTASGLTATSYTPTTPLNPATVYHWRVRATNPCGSMVSDPRSFQTLAVICQIYTSSDVPKAIPDNNPLGVTSTLDVPAGGAILDVNVLGLTGLHPWISDLTFDLISPANTSVRILDEPCWSEDNFALSLDDEASGPYPCPPTGGGTYLPDNPLSAFDGEGSPGTWRLNVADHFSRDTGQLQAWGLEICTGSFVPRERVYLPLVSKP